MGTSALGGFTSGLMQGMEFTDDRRRKKAVDNLLDREAYESDLDYEGRRIKWKEQYGDLPFPEFQNPAEEDPWMVKGFNFLKDRFGFGSGQEDQTYGVVTEPEKEPREAISDEATSKGRFYADGGKVEDEQRMKRSYGDYYVTEDEATANREKRQAMPPRFQSPYSPYNRDTRGRERAGRTAIPTFTGSGPGIDKEDFIEAGGDIKNAITDSNTYKAFSNLGEVAEADVRMIGEANSPEAAGNAVRGSMVDAGAGAVNLAGGVAADVSEGLGLDKIPGFVRGFVGRGGTRANPKTSPYGEHPMPDKFDPNMKLGVDSAIGDGKTDAKVASDAVDNAVAMTPGHPDHPDQAFDWAEVAASGVSADDIPHMGVKDWARYREAAMKADILAGRDVEQTQMNITKMQMQGAMSNMMQGAFLMRSGDMKGAELAMRAAFQYFPNGSDVRFGTYNGPDGPVLVGMGVDEETGEPLMQGRPMLLNPDTIAAMAANFSDPKHFNLWTKDWHTMAQADREREEIDKPLAQGRLNLMGAQEDAARAGAELDRATAAAGGRGAASRGSAIKESDYRESNATLAEMIFNSPKIPEESLTEMEGIATWLRQKVPSQSQLSDRQIVLAIEEFVKTGDASVFDKYVKVGE